MVEQAKVDIAQMPSRQMQLEKAVGAMSQEINTIKQLLERLVAPQAHMVIRGETAAEERPVEQQSLRSPHVHLRP